VEVIRFIVIHSTNLINVIMLFWLPYNSLSERLLRVTRIIYKLMVYNSAIGW